MDTISKIFSLMKSKKIPQNDFARIIGVKPQSVTDWKAGRSESYLKMIDKIAECLEVTTDYLLGKEQKEKPTTVSDDGQSALFRAKFQQLTPEQRRLVEAHMDLMLESQPPVK